MKKGTNMGADLMVTAVEIPHGREPDWGAANRHLEGLSDREVVEVVLLVEHGEDLDEDITPTENAEQYGVTVASARERLDTALTECEEGWCGGRRGMTLLSLVANAVLVAADQTWGDPVPEIDHLVMFVESGMAKAAGFLTE